MWLTPLAAQAVLRALGRHTAPASSPRLGAATRNDRDRPLILSTPCKPLAPRWASPTVTLSKAYAARINPDSRLHARRWLVTPGPVQPSPQHPGSSSLLVIQVHRSKIAMSEGKVADWKILINQGEK